MISNWSKELSRKLLFPLFLLLTTLCLLLSGCGALINNFTDTTSDSQQNQSYNNEQEVNHEDANQSSTTLTDATSPLTSFEDVAAYIRKYATLPDNFIKKKDAEALGWVSSKGNLQDIAPHMSIGGDKFGNREGLLPKADGRIWYEADINYSGGRRNADRIVFSNDGLIYMTTDHYRSFTNITEGNK